MLSKEDLLAISGILDTKLEPICSDIKEVKQDVALLKEDVALLKEDVSSLKEDVSSLKKEVNSLTLRMDRAEEKLDILDHKVTLVKLNQEVSILPRLQTIESCYTDTYHRYSVGIAQMEQLQQDVDVLKVTVAMHSKQLESIA